jgi:YYY domain-containing protein
MQMSQRQLRVGLCLVIILAVAFFLRIIGLNWDNHSYLHPDERFLTTIASKIGEEEQLSDAVRERCDDQRYKRRFFDTACSPYNPNNVNDGSFAYGTLPLFIVRAVAHLAERINIGQIENPQQWHSYDYIHLVGRATNSIIDVLTIVLVFIIGTRLFTVTRGLLAAAFYAFAVLPIQLSHFWIVDIQANFFFLIGLLAAVELRNAEKFHWYVVFGLALGATLASRINLVPMVILLPIVLLIRWQHVYASEANKRDLRHWLITAASLAIASVSIGFIAFRIFQPYAFMGPRFTDIQLNPKWVDDVRHVSELSAAPSEGWPPSIQWFNRTRYIYPLTNLILWGLGPIVSIVALISCVVAVLIQIRKRRIAQDTGILILWIVGYFAVMGGVHQMTMRYYLPLYAPLCLMAAWGLFKLSDWWRKRAIAATLLVSVIWAVSFASIYLNTLTRIEASQWIIDEIPGTIAFSNDDDDIVSLAIDRNEFTYHLQTAQNHESYLGESFGVSDTQAFQGFTLEFMEPIVVDFTLQLMAQPHDEDTGVAVYQLDLQTDANGVHQYNARDDANFTGIEPGRYRWHIQFDWSDTALLHHFMFTTQWAGAAEQQRTHTFLSPNTPIAEVLLNEPALNEPYLSEPFDVGDTQAFDGLTLEFMEPVVVDFRLQLMVESDDEEASFAYRFDMQTDANGARQYNVRDHTNFPSIESGRYRWHLQFNGSDTATLPAFTFTTQWAGEPNQQLLHTFLSPDVPVAEVLPDEQALNEPYLSEPFDVGDNEEFQGFTLEFAAPIVVDFTLQLMTQRDNEDAGVTVYLLDLQTDANGVSRYNVWDDANFIGIEPGHYQWHIQFNGADTSVPNTFNFTTRWAGEADEQPTHTFLSPYPSVDYVLLDEQGLEAVLNPPDDNQYSKIILPHIRTEIDSLTVQIGDRVIRANSIATLHESSLLGSGRIFELEEPINATAAESLALIIRSNEPVLLTGSAVATEGAWDDTLPSRHCRYERTGLFLRDLLKLRSDCIGVDAYAHGFYRGLPLNIVEPDTRVKWLRISAVLMKADYLVISSNRFYDALTRIPDRFPASVNYYDSLFREDLGYNTAIVFQQTPTIFGLSIPDQALPSAMLPRWLNEIEAEEAFTVYDHPTVYIFKNTNFDDEHVERLLSAVVIPDSEAIADAPSVATATINLQELQPPTFSQDGIELTPNRVIASATYWILGFIVIGWISIPLMFWLFPMLPLHGLWFGRSIVWLMLSVVSWWLTSVLSARLFWTQAGLWSLVVVYSLISLAVAWRTRDALLDFVKLRWKSIVAAECFFIIALMIGLTFRAVNPDLWHTTLGGEKPMDFAYFNAVLRTPTFPPPNPWLSGFQINYYYFGFVIAAVPTKLGNFPPSVATNLVLATVYALVMVNTAGFLYAILNRTRRFVHIALTIIGTSFVMLSGNLATLLMLLQNESVAAHRWYWYPTRVLAEAGNPGDAVINEFPAFSFLYGDLHAHILTLLPITCFVLVLLVIIRQRNWWLGILLGQLAAIIYMSNTWDVLLYVPLGFIGMLLATRSLPQMIRLSMAVGIGGIVTVLPFLISNELGTNGGILLWTGGRSFVEPFFVVWGIPIIITLIYINHRLKQVFFQQTLQPIETGLIALAVLIIMLLPTQFSTSGLCALLVLAAGVLFVFDNPQYRKISIAIMVIYGILLLLEYIIIRGDVGRMNTVFKISFQLWLWMGVLLVLILQAFVENSKWRLLFISLCVLGVGLLFPIKAVPARFEDNQSQTFTLDGNAFLRDTQLTYRDVEISLVNDRDLISFMQRDIDGFPIIAEWYATEYNWNSRISVQTGLPSVIGWQNHLKQQYTLLHPEIEQRVRDIQTLYTTGEQEEIERIISNYGIEYIVVGELERVFANPATLDLFESLAQSGELELIYNENSTQLYQVQDVSS